MIFQLNAQSKILNQVHFYYKKGKILQISENSNDLAKKDINELFKNENITAKMGELVFYRNSADGHQLFVGLETDSLNSEKLRDISAKIYQKLKAEKIETIKISLESIPLKDKSQVISAMTEGLLMSSYQFDTFKESPKKKNPEFEVHFVAKNINNNLKTALKEAEILAKGVNFTRWLGDCPANFMTPSQLAEEAKNSAKSTKMKVTIWDKAKIAKEKMDSIIGVSNGSDEEPRFIIMEYKGAPASKKPICFVGKGLTFDCGGISIKPSAGMEEMKFDMCGGSAVIGALSTIAKLQLKVNVIGIVPASENMPGPSANKPGDIRKARNGKSIEINNTDAEGRLILADALCYASEQKPAWIIDTATLTGAMMVALGNTHSGFYSRNSKMVEMIYKASHQSGEEVWHMPLCDHHVNDMKGHYADLTNLAPSRNAGSATAAAFLESFVEKEIPWAHIDIAGTAWHVGQRQSYAPLKGASGVMVRTFVQLARNQK
jgi:leucyl aminopeptidase